MIEQSKNNVENIFKKEIFIYVLPLTKEYGPEC